MPNRLGEQLDRARWVRYDAERDLLLVWKGGHGIHVLNMEGVEVSFWSTGNFQLSDADEDVVWASMEQRMLAGDYP
jgi:hypothetical protein